MGEAEILRWLGFGVRCNFASLLLAQLTISKIVGGVRMVVPVFSGLSYTITELPFHNCRVTLERAEIALQHYNATVLEIMGHLYQGASFPMRMFQGSRQVLGIPATFLPQEPPASLMVWCAVCWSGQGT